MAENEEKVEATITIRVKDAAGEEMYFKVKKATRMEKIFSAYATRRGSAISKLIMPSFVTFVV